MTWGPRDCSVTAVCSAPIPRASQAGGWAHQVFRRNRGGERVSFFSLGHFGNGVQLAQQRAE